MHSLFEHQDSLNNPVECFIYDAAAKGFPVKPHWHYFAEFIFMLSGSAAVTSDDRTYTISEGELMILHPSAVHSFFSAGETLPVYVVLKFDLRRFPGNSSYSPPSADIFKYARSCGMESAFSREQSEMLRCREIFTTCAAEMKEFLFGVDVVVRAKIYELIYGIIRLWIASGLNISDCPASAETYGIENITEYIDAHLDESIRVAAVAERCHLSYSNFAAKFREFYGMSCKEYIERMKLFKAEEYLLFTDHDLSFISQQTGFSDCSHFIRTFKRYRGITPKQFRMKRK